MGILKVFYIMALPLVVSYSGLGSEALAGPPVDLSDFKKASKTVRKRASSLKDKDMIFTDNVIKPEKIIKSLVLFKKTTYGRTRATKKSKAILKFRKDFRARFLQFSQNKEWVAIELLNKKRKAWVPVENIRLLDEAQQSKLREAQEAKNLDKNDEIKITRPE